MAKQFWKGGALLAPVPPVLVTCGTAERANILTIGWTGICATHPPMTYISVRPTRHSYGIIRETGEFAVNLTTTATVRAADFCGVRSGRDTDKAKACGLHLTQTPFGNVPVLEESPVSLVCAVKQVIPLGSHDMFMAEIVAVHADERLFDKKTGAMHLERANLVSYSNGHYYDLGKIIGKFGFSVEKRPSAASRPARPSRKA